MNTLAVLFYLAGAACAVLLIVKVSRTRAGAGGPLHDRHEAAFLNGGPARVVDAALAALQADGRIAIGGPGIVAVLRPTAHDPVERAVLQQHAAAPHGALHHLRLMVMRHPAVQEVGDALAARGLIVTPSARRSVLRWSAGLGISSLVLVPVSLFLTVLDLAGADAGDLPVPFILKVLPALLGAGITAVVCGSIASGRVTPAGRHAVAVYGRAYGHLADAGHLVALHGLRALPDLILREQLLAAARVYAPRRRGGGGGRPTYTADTAGLVAVWCAAGADGGSGGGGCGSSGGGGGGGGCSAGSCSGGGSSCGSSGGGGGSSCSSSGGSSGSSCSSSSGSSCSSSSSSS
ncbi:TIGR04222 domain-containing membrane protein [Streptomyces sp. ISL-36]|uniref:TIGR04222 domain-containing membrane protein n=1 Tax=Streptomyces sp. ISL-36 TaxID=2819182 RepID=UPI001BE9D82F|nr:TIGR04222 domain-containing membrane protein [Streptomyces sp. ISL-36]MBT2440006.1 TIGR04222 domain-containing membrane protein [Streptomyces sp. ISL-36]